MTQFELDALDEQLANGSITEDELIEELKNEVYRLHSDIDFCEVDNMFLMQLKTMALEETLGYDNNTANQKIIVERGIVDSHFDSIDDESGINDGQDKSDSMKPESDSSENTGSTSECQSDSQKSDQANKDCTQQFKDEKNTSRDQSNTESKSSKSSHNDSEKSKSDSSDDQQNQDQKNNQNKDDQKKSQYQTWMTWQIIPEWVIFGKQIDNLMLSND